MSYELGKREGNKIKITYTVDSKDWIEAIDKSYKKNKSKFNIEGFRKGKAPRAIIEKNYGPTIFYDDALNFVIADYYYNSIKESNLRAVGHPEIDVTAISDTTLNFIAVATLYPEVKLGEYTGFDIAKKKATVKKSDVDAAIKLEVEKAIVWENVDNRACKLMDTVNINYSGSVNGEKFEGGTAENQPLELGSGQFIPGFEDQVVGMKIGDKKDINVKFPKEYHAELADKDAVFEVEVLEIKKKIIPNLDDELVKDISEFNTVAEFEKSIKEKLKAEKEHEIKHQHENAIIEKVIKNAKVEIPEVMVEEAIEYKVNEFAQRMQQQGISLEDYFKYTGSKKEDLVEQYREVAKKDVLSRVVIDAIIKKEKFDATDKEVDEKIKEYAKQAKIEYDAYKKMIPDLEFYVKQSILSEKFIEFIVDKNTKK